MIVFKFPRKRQFATVAFSHDMTQLAAAGPSDPVVVWDVATRAELHRFKPVVAHTTQSIVFHPRAHWLYVAASYGLTAFNTDTGASSALWRHEEFARNVAVDSTGKRLVGARHKLWTDDPNLRWLTCLDVSKPDTPTPDWELKDSHAPHDAHTELVAFFPDEKRIATAEVPNRRISYDTRLAVRTAASGELVNIFSGTGTDAQQLAVSPLGTHIVSRVDRRLYIFDVANPTAAARELVNNHKRHFTGIAFHPAGKYLAATSNDETVKLYDTTSWEIAHTFTWKLGKIRSIAFSADGTLAAAGSDSGQVVVWDVDV